MTTPAIERIGNFLFRTRNLLFPLAFVLVLLPGPPVLGSNALAAAAGLAVALAGQLVRATTIGLHYIIRGGRDRRVYAEDLVTEGLYAHSRNPMYVGNVLIATGVALASNSWSCLLAVAGLFAFCYYAITRAEEAYLAAKFGPGYVAYCRDVPRFLPRLAGLGDTFRRSAFRWRRVLVKEYGTFLGWPLRWMLVVIFAAWRDGELVVRPGLVPGLLTAAAFLGAGYLAVRVLKKQRRLVAD